MIVSLHQNAPLSALLEFGVLIRISFPVYRALSLVVLVQTKNQTQFIRYLTKFKKEGRGFQ